MYQMCISIYHHPSNLFHVFVAYHLRKHSSFADDLNQQIMFNHLKSPLLVMPGCHVHLSGDAQH